MLFAAAGIFTPIIEGAATAIGAGMVVGGFSGATRGVIRSESRKEVEDDALRATYLGAVVALASWAVDQCIVYAKGI